MVITSFLDLVFVILFGRIPDTQAIETVGRMEKPHHMVLQAMASPEYTAPPIMNMRSVRELGSQEITGIHKYFPESQGTNYEGYTREAFIKQFLNEWLAREFRKDGFTYVQMKSLPRSGHHFLILLLRDYFRETVHYCESYAPLNCCRNIPCVKPFNPNFTNRYMIQKSHDFELKDIKSTAFKYVIQHRAIITRMQSNFELAILNPHSGLKDTRDDFQKFCLLEAERSIEFYKKWLGDDGLNKCIMTYEELIENTGKTLARVIRYIADDPAGNLKNWWHVKRNIIRFLEHNKRINHALKLKDTKVNTFNSPVGRRDPSQHRYFDKGFYIEIEQRVHTQCPTVKVDYYFL
jgi:hypothetical protein